VENILIQNCIQGCQRSQTKLYNKYWKTMYTFIKKYINDVHLAEEICNSGFNRVFCKLHLFSNIGSFEGWVRKIMINEVKNYANSDDRVANGKKNIKKGYIHNVLYDSKGEVRENLFSTSPKNNLYIHDINKIINLIPNKTCSKTFRLFIQGYSHKEIGEMLNMSEGTSKWYVSDARTFIKKHLN